MSTAQYPVGVDNYCGGSEVEGILVDIACSDGTGEVIAEGDVVFIAEAGVPGDCKAVLNSRESQQYCVYENSFPIHSSSFSIQGQYTRK